MKVICVGGCSSDSGKTAVVSLLLKAFPGWAAVKVTPCRPDAVCPHGNVCGACSTPDGPYEIVSDPVVLAQPGKDTALFLEAGASRVLWVRSAPENLSEALKVALHELLDAPGVIVESTTALSLLEGLKILVARPSVGSIKASAMAALEHVDFVALNIDADETASDAIESIQDMLGPGRPVVPVCAALPLESPMNQQFAYSCSEETDSRDISYLRLSIVDACDLRCSYCVGYKDTLPRTSLPLTLKEMEVLVDAFARNGITKVRLTGGEPLVRPDVVEIVRAVAQTPGIHTVGLTTNGIRLESLAAELAHAGLNAVNISLDTLRPSTFREITGKDQLDCVIRGLGAALACGFDKVKLNTVVMRGVNDDELPQIADLANKLPIHVRFIELMPLGYSTEQWRALHVPASEILDILGNPTPRETHSASSARLYDLPGGGVVGVISPMSAPFCDSCNRIRVTSAGVLKPCLRLPVEENIRSLLGSSDLVPRLGEIIARLSCHKLSGTSAMAEGVQADAMCLVGG